MERYLQTTSSSRDIFLKIFQSFRDHNIAPTPLNYLVWYEYHLQKNTELINVIKENLNSGEGYNNLLGFRVFHNYLRDIPSDVHVFNEEMFAHIKDVALNVEAVDSHIDEHIKILEGKDRLQHQIKVSRLQAKLQDTKTQFKQTLRTSYRLANQVEKVSNFILKDPITLLHSQEKLLQDLKAISNSENMEPGLILIDMDNYRLFNRTHGISSSEKTLRLIGSALKEEVGEQCVYRLKGHDEFCIMTGDSKGDALEEKAVRCMEAIQGMAFKKKGEDKPLDEKLDATYVLFSANNSNFEKSYQQAKNRIKSLKRKKRNRR